jgi:hypothetical protein
MATPQKLSLPVLDDGAAKLFDQYLRSKALAAKAYDHDKKAKQAKVGVIEAMGESMIAQLPDGRIVQRINKSRKMAAKPAHEQSWEDLIQAEL